MRITTWLRSYLFVYLISPGVAMAVFPLDTAWVRVYDGPGHGLDEAHDVQVDVAGNVCVAGNSAGDGTNADYGIIKYDPHGDRVWVHRYNGPENGSEELRDLQIDEAGNVYVTGRRIESSNSEYCTVKLNSDGDTLWVRKYEGSPFRDNRATALAVDESGNVYVTGHSEDAAGANDCATIKYNEQGDTLWVRRFGVSESSETAWALDIDAVGNVYVAGSSRTIGPGDAFDYLTIKYTPDGDTLWARYYNGPGDDKDEAHVVRVDSDGNVYVTGHSTGAGTYWDFATIKYDADGDTLWVRRYDGTGEWPGDAGSDLEMDIAGNVYVTGVSRFATDNYTTIKYEPEGDTVWVSHYDGPAIEGGSAFAMILDAAGNAYVTGANNGIGTDFDCVTLVYDNDGTLLHELRYDGPTHGDDRGLDIGLDPNGDIIVAGYTYNGYDVDYLTIKYLKCRCPHQGDADEDSSITILDLSAMIDALFVGGTNPIDHGCRTFRHDWDCDGYTTAADLASLIDHLFAGGDGPCEPCGE